MTVRFSEAVIPLTDLKTNPGRVVRQVADSRRPVLLTSHGRGVAVVQSIADQAAEEERELMRAVGSCVAPLDGHLRRGGECARPSGVGCRPSGRRCRDRGRSRSALPSRGSGRARRRR